MFPKPGSTCARLNEVFARSWAPDARGRRGVSERKSAALRDGIAEARGKAVGLVMVWDPLQCRVNHLSEGMTLSARRDRRGGGVVCYALERRHFATFASPEASPPIGSQLLREICEEMVVPGDVKLSLYSGHDSTPMSLRRARRSWALRGRMATNSESSLIFETWRMTDGTLGVRAVYNGEPLALTPTSRASDGITRYEDFESFVRRRVRLISPRRVERPRKGEERSKLSEQLRYVFIILRKNIQRRHPSICRSPLTSCPSSPWPFSPFWEPWSFSSPRRLVSAVWRRLAPALGLLIEHGFLEPPSTV